jgi:hypothetical protein
MSLEAQKRIEPAPRMRIDDPRYGRALADLVLSRRGATLRATVVMLLPLAAVAAVALAAMPFMMSAASTLLGIIAGGSGGIGAYLAVRAGRENAMRRAESTASPIAKM